MFIFSCVVDVDYHYKCERLRCDVQCLVIPLFQNLVWGVGTQKFCRKKNVNVRGSHSTFGVHHSVSETTSASHYQRQSEDDRSTQIKIYVSEKIRLPLVGKRLKKTGRY